MSKRIDMSNTTKTVRYQCAQCGNCCRWEGYVRLTKADVEAIADYLDMTPKAFVYQYAALTHDRRSLTLVENEQGYCIMLTDEGLCRIHPVKPKQCRDFPDKWNFPGFERLCHALRIEE